MRVVEVSYAVPPEVFIRRHVEALRGAPNLEILLVGRSPARGERPASAAQGPLQPYERVMPNFDHIGLPQKVWSLRYALRRAAWRDGLLLRDRAVLGFFDSLEPDLIHFHMASLAVLMRWIPQALGIPYTVSLRGSDVQVEPLMSASRREAVRETLEAAAGIHSVCRHLAELARELGVNKPITTIYTAVPVPKELPPYPPPGDVYRFVTVGRLHWRKNLPELLRAFRSLLDGGLRAELKIIGSGPEEPTLRYWTHWLRLDAHVTFAGRLSEEQIIAELRSAHAYVQSSVAEGLSNSLAEAMAWGCPVFATDAGGTCEVLEDFNTGIVLPLHAPEQWAAKMAAAADFKLLARIRTAAFTVARVTFAREVHAVQFASFWPGATGCVIGLQPNRAAVQVNRER